MTVRSRIPRQIETEVLTSSRRRCCLCWGLLGDYGQKKGQIAHLDHNPANNDIDNLAFLCLDHHDKYDSSTRQSKNYTIQEVKSYRQQLLQANSTSIALPTGKNILRTDAYQDQGGQILAEEGGRLLQRIKIQGEYIEHICALIGTDEPITAVDVSGLATNFAKWTTDSLYRGILVANEKFNIAFRRRNGGKIGVRRIFVVDPDRISESVLANLEAVLFAHLRIGISAGVILTTQHKVPEEVLSDLALLGNVGALDAKRIEPLDRWDSVPQGNFYVNPRTKMYKSIKERVLWASSNENVDLWIEKIEQVEEIITLLRNYILNPHSKYYSDGFCR
jgi:hypothetical protein